MPYPSFVRLAIPLLLSVASFPTLALDPPTTPVEPRYELVDANGTIDVYIDIAVDPAGSRPALLYYDTTTADPAIAKPIPLRLARHDRFSWAIETLGLVNRRGSAADERSLRLAIDGSGAAHALVIESNGAGNADDALIYFGPGTEGTTLREQIDVDTVTQIALAVDIIAEPYVAYIKGNGTLVIRRRGDGSWPQIALTPTPTNASTPSFAPYPAQANFLAMHLAWVEYAPASSVLRHAAVSTQTATADTIASTASPYSLSAPQIVVDRFGTLEVAYVSSTSPLAPTVELRRREFNQGSWSCIDTGCTLPTGPLPTGFALSTHGYVQGALNFREGSVSRMLRREGAGWTNYAMADVANAQGSALDQFGNVYTTGIDRSTHHDLFAVRIGGPWESRGRIPNDSDDFLPQPFAVASDAQSHPVVYARRATGSDPRGSLWLVGTGNDFVEVPVPGSFTAAEASIAVASDGAIHLALYDTDQSDLIHARYLTGTGAAGWTITRVDTLGDAGTAPTMLIGHDGGPMIVYRRRPDLMHLAALGPSNNWVIRSLAAGVFNSARPVASNSRESAIVHVSWFDEEQQRLKVTSLRGNPLDVANVAVTQSTPVSPGWISGRVHDITMLGDGGVAIAYSNETGGQSQLGYSYRDYTGQWFGASEPEAFGPGQITRISLSNAALSRNGARVAWIIGGRLHYAEQQLGIVGWSSEDLGPIPPAAPMQFGAAGPLRIVYDEGNGPFLLQRLEDLGVDSAITDIYAYSTYVGVIFNYCACTLRYSGNPAYCEDAPARAAGSPMPARDGQTGAASDSDVLSDVRALFATSAAGRYYLDLFALHAPEIIALTLSEPALLIQRTRTLSDLLPGLTALVDSPSRGDQYRFSAEQIANARAVVQAWGNAGSPELAAAVAAELERTDDFTQFVGMSFSEWFGAISVGTSLPGVFRDGFE